MVFLEIPNVLLRTIFAETVTFELIPYGSYIAVTKYSSIIL